MGTHLRILSESHPMNTMTRFRWFSKFFASLFFGRKVDSASQGLNMMLSRWVWIMKPNVGVSTEGWSCQKYVYFDQINARPSTAQNHANTAFVSYKITRFEDHECSVYPKGIIK